jgi:mRNA interferase YafQ
MRHTYFTTAFKKDLKRQRKRGKSRQKLEAIMNAICRDGDAPLSCRPHNLIGNYHGKRECHIEPDWLIIFTVTDETVTFYRTGTHNDLFQ